MVVTQEPKKLAIDKRSVPWYIGENGQLYKYESSEQGQGGNLSPEAVDVDISPD